ncbi:MAG: hypothetical protein COZ75_01325 [Flavobacteriaceae bacterium CG_4_8_14_3_um_filter_34_10]|nr:DMT family transporter [Flavobacteriia bacterium]OIP51717.1 MAG: hypothetical protein AUK33_03485 [Flavobacteriaceae bacterium CG2_30_34_30]PIQ17110.1 MAG: hypothetical protein COW66_13335 [Flavobacteriaceae bacterium CG18_big_fil_WC_8_21_14_2_50_34_36]PIV48911.1 MAG: hypothetical protein COS19_11340 [Flavobacteriaceae bacterium CG02_land_8_20_14_3_00_34_13]PIX10487.1 MAG: hypothetical protein COZ75_01325 [Flavobacteriaceae bacterium CG_4_8_14_3_um_filter_34_10]PIZ07957.1 MAG: hypothetical 
MIYLALSILVSSFLYVVFNLFERFKIHTLHAIVVNYMVAFGCGILFSNTSLSVQEIYQTPWFFGALGLGVLFVFIFNIMAITVQRSGLSVASIATKMSVVIPVIFGFFMYKESAGFLKIIGILLALIAVYLASIKSKEGVKIRNLIFPILLFLGSGIIDTSLKYLQNTHIKDENLSIFSAITFLFAGLSGLLFAILKHDLKISWKSIIAGICLGIPNYFSIVTLMKALATEGLESSSVFTINNVGVVMLSTLLGLFFFKERLLTKNWIGVLLAIISIFLVVYR